MPIWKVITLTPPYGSLIAASATEPHPIWGRIGKHYETRSWATSYRGPLLIHQAKGLGRMYSEQEYAQWCHHPGTSDALHALGYENVLAIPRGFIVAYAELVAIHRTEEIRPRLTWPEPLFGDYTPGRYAWELTNIRRLDPPVAAKGAQGLWTWEGELPNWPLTNKMDCAMIEVEQ